MPRPTTTLFQDAIDIPLWLEADRLTPFAKRVHRDREIARHLPAAQPIGRIRAWWRDVGPDSDEGAGARLERIRRLLAVAMAALGAVGGMSVALAAFRYDGSQPVNVVRLIALLVGVQLILLLSTALLLPRRIPVLRGLQDLIATISPGALAVSISQRIVRARPDLAGLFDRHAARASAGRFAKWQLLYFAQVAAVAFNVAAIATAIALVTFTDLAFGWSTTLSLDAATVSRIVEAIAWPWHTIVPSAVPSSELVEQSQFFRLEGANAPGAGTSRTLAGWWPFTICALVTYGLLPRLALLSLAALRRRAATTALLLDDPRVTALLDRMNSPSLETAAAEHEEAPRGGARAAARAERTGTGIVHAVVWEDCLTPDAAQTYAREHFGFELAAVAEAGGSRALSSDEAALERIAAAKAATLVVFTPAWEPPLLEFLDFLKELRRRVGGAATIIVAPVPEASRAVSEIERETWARAVGRLADPHSYVETGAA